VNTNWGVGVCLPCTEDVAPDGAWELFLSICYKYVAPAALGTRQFGPGTGTIHGPTPASTLQLFNALTMFNEFE
jgi:hypothetical protein